MSRQTSMVMGLLGALSVALLAFVGRGFVAGRLRASGSPAEAVVTIPKADKSSTSARTADEIATPSWGRPEANAGSRPAEGAARDDKAELTLGKEQREYLWQIEHHGLILGRVGFTRIAKAIKNGDAPASLPLLAEGFEGEVLRRAA